MVPHKAVEMPDELWCLTPRQLDCRGVYFSLQVSAACMETSLQSGLIGQMPTTCTDGVFSGRVFMSPAGDITIDEKNGMQHAVRKAKEVRKRC